MHVPQYLAVTIRHVKTVDREHRPYALCLGRPRPHGDRAAPCRLSPRIEYSPRAVLSPDGPSDARTPCRVPRPAPHGPAPGVVGVDRYAHARLSSCQLPAHLRERAPALGQSPCRSQATASPRGPANLPYDALCRGGPALSV